MIEIDELTMSIPDISPEQAEPIGHDVAARLLETLPQHYAKGNIDVLNIQLTAQAEFDHDQLVNDIAAQIRSQLLNR